MTQSAEKDLTPEQIKAGATALYSCGATVPDGVSYADVVRDVVAATRVASPAEGCDHCGCYGGHAHPTCPGDQELRMILTEFLLARIAEDERTIPCEWNCHERVYRECDAKRRIVEAAEQFGTWEGGMGDVATRLLAAVYADHPDYDEEWLPY